MISKISKTGKMRGFMRMEGYEQEDVTVNCQDGGPPKWERNHPRWEVHLKTIILDFELHLKQAILKKIK